MTSKKCEQEQARQLRRQGCSVRSIATKLGVAQSSVSVWVRDIRLTDRQQKVLQAKQKNYGRLSQGPEKLSKKALEQRQEYQNEGRRDAACKDLCHIVGCILYWAEGSKKRNSAVLANTDPQIIIAFVRCLTEFFKVDKAQMKLWVRAYADNGVDEQAVSEYWSSKTGIADIKVQFDVDGRNRSGKKKNVHPYGICEISVHDTKLVQRIYGAIQKFVGFENSDWAK